MASIIPGYSYDIFISNLQNMEAKFQAEHERVRKWLVKQGIFYEYLPSISPSSTFPSSSDEVLALRRRRSIADCAFA